MTKEEWQKLYGILSNTHRDFQMAYPNYKNGKNKQIRKDAERQVDNAISLADYHLRANWEAFTLLTGKDASGFERKIVHDEFLLPQWFGGDMRDLLTAMEAKIKSFDE